MSKARQRTAGEVIDQAIIENRAAGHFLYLCCGTPCLVGLFVLVWACVKGESIVALAGTLPTALIWPAIAYAQAIRKENIALRTLEIPLNEATSEAAAAETLRKVFYEIFLEPSKQPS